MWLLGVPLHKVPPLVLAAVARGSSDDASVLTEMHFQLVDMLHAVHIYPVSHAADGTEVERSTQRNIENRARSFREYIIGTPIPDLTLSY